MKQLLPYFIQSQLTQRSFHGSLDAYTLFIDLSGFTRLTDTLMKRGTEGAERLSVILNKIFSPMVSLVYRQGGFIPHFAGDAFIAVFDQRVVDSNRFLQTVAAVYHHFLEQEQFDEFTIGIKAGLSAGNVEWGILGKTDRTFYFRGEAIDGCAFSQLLANGQEVIADLSLRRLISDPAFHFEPVSSGATHYRLFLPPNPGLPTPLNVEGTIDPDIVRLFLPEAVVEYNQSGEFRSVVSLFLSFEGIGHHDVLDVFSTLVLEQVHNFSAYLKEVEFGDKGGVMTVFFGAPISYENNIDRALQFAWSLMNESKAMRQQHGFNIRMGITSGIAYTGIVGGAERSQYAVVGNRVNLASRLVSQAAWDEVLVDEHVYKSKLYQFAFKGNIHYKGIENGVPTYSLVGLQTEDKTSFSGRLIGRTAELEQLMTLAQPLFEGKFAGIASIYGEAGIGKSRLSYEFKHQLKRHHEINWLFCPTDQILRKPFNPFSYMLRHAFKQQADKSPRENEHNFEHQYTVLLDQIRSSGHPDADSIARELVRTKSIIAALMGISLPGSLWEQLDAKGRYDNTIAALYNILLAAALTRPTVIELEDAHWCDDSSLELMHELMRRGRRFPLLLLITSRYQDDDSKTDYFSAGFLAENKIPVREINLNILSPEAIREVAETRLGGAISQDFHDMLLRTTNGNPFYTEQILEYFSETNLIAWVDNQWVIKDKNIRLSDSINAILIARIDRLSSLVKETIKAAAVIGREFEVSILSEVMKNQEAFIRRNGNMQEVLKEQIHTAEKWQIWRAINELRYIFKHSLLREAVYDMQLRTRLRSLHQQIAEAIEKLYAGNLEEKYVDLVFHYEQADIAEKTNDYLKKAADYARRNYQNQQALLFYDKLLVNLRKSEEQGDRIAMIRILLKKGDVLEMIGEWEDCEKHYREALALATQIKDQLLQARTNSALGNLLLLKGNYEEARLFLEIGAGFFEFLHDDFGIANAYGSLGNLYFRQGKYEEAKAYFIRSIELNNTLDNKADAQIAANLGLTYMNTGNYEAGIRCQQEQLTICESNNDKKGMAILCTNLGIVYFEKGEYQEALKFYQKGLAISEELGNKMLKAIAIGCIGNVYERQGNYPLAMEHYLKDLDLCEELGDKQGIAIALGLIGGLHSLRGNFEQAIEYLEKNLALCQQLGYQKGISKAINTLGDIYHLKQEYERSVGYYNQSIDIARNIGNKLLLASSLLEKTAVLVEKNDLEGSRECIREGAALAEALGNHELIFKSWLLLAQLNHMEGDTPAGLKLLGALQQQHAAKPEQAALYDAFHTLDPKPEYRQRAIALYRELYEQEPNYLYKLRLDYLQQN